jgi:Mn2+/Fe2+ NRAMP family transporter
MTQLRTLLLDASQSVNLVFYYYTRAVMIFFVGQSETMHHVYISRAMTLVGLSLTNSQGN